MRRQSIAAAIRALGDREFKFTAATDQLARDGHVLLPSGMQLGDYRRNRIILWLHDPQSGRSIDFETLDNESLDPKKPRGGVRILTSSLMEISLVAVGADTNALITARAHDWRTTRAMTNHVVRSMRSGSSTRRRRRCRPGAWRARARDRDSPRANDPLSTAAFVVF
jgi:hypothetical protein